jgi:hypothetical protein
MISLVVCCSNIQSSSGDDSLPWCAALISVTECGLYAHDDAERCWLTDLARECFGRANGQISLVWRERQYRRNDATGLGGGSAFDDISGGGRLCAVHNEVN